MAVAMNSVLEKLGFEVVHEKTVDGLPFAFLQMGTMMVETYETKEAAMAAGAIDHVAIDVSDVEAVYAWINEIGMNNTNDVINFLPFWENGFKYFKIDGPNKEVIEFGQIL